MTPKLCEICYYVKNCHMTQKLGELLEFKVLADYAPLHTDKLDFVDFRAFLRNFFRCQKIFIISRKTAVYRFKKILNGVKSVIMSKIAI